MLRHSARPSRTSGSGLCSQCTALVTMAGCSRAPGRRGPSWPLGEAGPQGLVAPAGPQGREGLQGPGRSTGLGRCSAAEPVLGPPGAIGPQSSQGEAGHKGRPTQWRTCPPGPQGAAGPAGPPGPAGPKGDPSPPPIFRVVTGTETLAARGASFWRALYARAAQSMEREGQEQRLAVHKTAIGARSDGWFRCSVYPLPCLSNRNPSRSGTRKSR